MSNLHISMAQLREDILTLLSLVKDMFQLSHDAMLKNDLVIVEEIVKLEAKVNALELHIDNECENIIALYNPVAIDLRYVLSMMRMNSNLERMADQAVGIAKYLREIDNPFDAAALKDVRFEEMFMTASSMLEAVTIAFTDDDTSLARSVFQKDEILDEINFNCSTVLAKLCRKNPDNIRNYLFLFSIIRKMERFGDLAENIAEDIIFHIEAKVMKHSKPLEDSDGED